MTLRQYLFSMFLGTLVSWLAWGMIIKSTDPFASAISTHLLFFLTFFLSLVGTFAVLGFAIRAWIIKEDEIIFRNVRKTFRQGILFAVIVCISLFLQGQRILTLWNAILLLGAGTFIEFYFISHNTTMPKKYNI